MHLIKNQRIRIACILLVVALLAIIAIIVVNEINAGKTDPDGKKLVDTIGKDSGNSVKVYITNDQKLILEFENIKHSDLTMSKSKLPVYDVSGVFDINGNTKTYEVMIYNKNTIPENVEPVTYPCECELEFFSNVFGQKYTVKFKVDDKVKYISGSMETKEVEKTDIAGYKEYSQKYGDIKLPDAATVLDYKNTTKTFTVNDATTTIEVGLCDYLHEGVKKQIITTKLENKELLDKIYCDTDAKKLKVNDIDVYVIEERGTYIACYTCNNMVYVNQGFCLDREGVDDNALIEALKPFI